MRMFCQNLTCDFEYEDNSTNAAIERCPKCYGSSFVSLYSMKNTIQITTARATSGTTSFTFEINPP